MADQCVVETVRAMDCDQLADMLKQVITDKKYQADLTKLIDGNIDGDLFLGLLEDKDLLSDLKLSPGGNAKIRSIINKIKDGSFELPEAGGQKLLEPDMPWCTAETPDDTSTAAISAITDSGMQGAWIPTDAVWPWTEGKKIYVKFSNVELLSDWTINNGQTMNTDTVLKYANTWNQMGGGKIPRFVDHEAEQGGQAHLRVSFNNDQLRNSQLGKRAQQVPISQPTMNLDLHNGCPDDQYKKHLIIHEFGHALGLGHEHQRSNFWTCIKPFVNVKEMKKGMSEKRFSIDWEKIASSELGPHTAEYDPDSIMHYWFKVEWLTNGYQKKEKVERDRDRGILSKMQAEALLGVHKRRESLAAEPSKGDIALLKQVYRGMRIGTDAGDPIIIEQPVEEQPGTVNAMQPNEPKPNGPDKPGVTEKQSEPMFETEYYDIDVKNTYLSWMDYTANGKTQVVKIYDSSAHMWRRIGENLGIEAGILTSIGRDGYDDRDRVTRVLSKWLENASNLPHSDLYPLTWKGLINLLQRSDLAKLAKDVHTALLQQKQSGSSAAGGPPPAMPNPGRCLSTDDLSAVTTAVWHARAKWKAIGLQLGIPLGDLDAIGDRHRNDSDACLPDMLTKFLQIVSPKQPTWSRLADAMASTMVGRGDIAKKLRRMN